MKKLNSTTNMEIFDQYFGYYFSNAMQTVVIYQGEMEEI